MELNDLTHACPPRRASDLMHNVEESIAAGERDRRLQENRYLLDAVPAAEIGSRAGPVHAASLKVWNAIAERSGVPYVDATLIASIPSDLLNDDLFYWDEIKPLAIGRAHV